jgi:hypothetical protein
VKKRRKLDEFFFMSAAKCSAAKRWLLWENETRLDGPGFSMWHLRLCGRSQTSAEYRENIFPAMKAYCVLLWP